MITLFAFTPTLAQTPTLTTIIEKINEQDIEVGVEIVDGYRQIYFLSGDEKIFISEGANNNHSPAINDAYITYIKDINGAGQIFLYHIPTEHTVQLTRRSTNLNPDVSSDGKLVWKRWITVSEKETIPTVTPDPSITPTSTPSADISTSTTSAAIATPTEAPSTGTSSVSSATLSEGWQIVVFDGVSSRQITQGGTTTNPDIEGDVVVFAETEFGDNWTAKAHSIAEQKTADISTGRDALYPNIDQGKIFLGHQSEAEEFPLTPEDILLLDLEPLSGNTPKTVSQEDIIKELEGLGI